MTASHVSPLTAAPQPADAPAAAGLIETCDIEEHEQAVSPWDVRFTQVSRGRFQASMRYVRTPGLMLYTEHWGRRVEVSGATPAGFFVLGTRVQSAPSGTEWCGEALDERRLAFGGPSTDVDFQVPDDARHVVLLVQPELLRRSLGPAAVAHLAGRRSVHLPEPAGRRLIAAMERTVHRYAAQPERLNDPFEARQLESRLCGEVARGLALRDPDGGAGPTPHRGAAVRRAVAYVERTPGPLTALELAVAARVSQRTLEYGFREHFDVTPAAYLRLHRLNEARRELADAGPADARVTDIALKWGFGHPGRFSVAYRKQFGEKPSETLAAARRPPPLRLVDLMKRCR